MIIKVSSTQIYNFNAMEQLYAQENNEITYISFFGAVCIEVVEEPDMKGGEKS